MARALSKPSRASSALRSVFADTLDAKTGQPSIHGRCDDDYDDCIGAKSMSESANVACSELQTATMADLLIAGLDVAFVSINPAIYSVLRGHYFARRSNKFWPCISRSNLTMRARRGLGVETLEPEHDRELLLYGIGFTDLVKRATARAADLAPRELAAGVDTLLEKIDRHRPRVACFHGVTGYRYVHRELVGDSADLALGLQDVCLGSTRVFVVPNPSGANAHFTRAEQTGWYDNLSTFLETKQHRPRQD
jgi:TDG/mug DNA glycosylase family protein